MSDDQLPPWINDKILRGQAILFLGAGASYGASGPNGEVPLRGSELRDNISDRFLGGALKDKPLAHVAEYAKNESSLSEVQQFIHEIFEPLQPADFHQLIPAFRWHAILSTNFDFVIERAYHIVDNPLQHLGRIVRDSDDFGKVISSLDEVPFLKLHGCLSVINDPQLPLILATEEYAKHRQNRERLFRHFEDWSKEYPIIFCGYDLSDSNIQQVLYDLGDSAIHRSPFVMVRPHLTGFDRRYWSSRRVIPISKTFEDFLTGINASLPKQKRVLGAFIEPGATSVQARLSRGKPTEVLRVYLKTELSHVRDGMPAAGVSPHEFYRGAATDWDAIRQNLDVKRRITDDLLIEAVLDAPTNSETKVFLVKGYAGSGKSVTMRRAAWEAATEHEAFVLWLRRGGLIRIDLIRELFSLTDDRIFLFVEDAVANFDHVKQLIDEAKRSHMRLTLILGARTNEWNVVGDSLDSILEADYELRDLSDAEINDLLAKLETASCLGSLVRLEKKKRAEHFVLTAERQLLVALHEATSGRPFEEIVVNEYRNLVPVEAQTLYLDVCTLHRFGVGVRAGLLSRVSGVTFSHFEKKLLGPLEHVIEVYFDGGSRDYTYRSRHSLVADFVFKHAFDGPEDRANQLVRIIRAMNTDYDSDKKAFDELIRGRDLASLFSDRVLADRVFEAAAQSGSSKRHIAHQRAVFELNHPGGSMERASRALDEAEKHSQHYSLESIRHTRAIILRRMALDSNSPLAARKYRDDAIQILKRQIRHGNKPHPFHALGELLLDEFREQTQDSAATDLPSELGERLLAESLSQIEKTIDSGYQRFPGDSYLLALEAKLAKLLRDNPRALTALKKAHLSNPHNEHIAASLSRMLFDQGEASEAKTVLQTSIEANPTAKLVRLNLAKALIGENEHQNRDEIKRLLRSAFTDGDTNYETQFWYARHEYLHGDQKKGKRVFKNLSAVKAAPQVRNRMLSRLKKQSGDLVMFEGSIKNVRDTFCFVTIPEINDDIFVHHSECSEKDWSNVKVGSRVKLAIAFSFKGPQGVDMHFN